MDAILEILQKIFARLFIPPPFPSFDLPWPARMASGVMESIRNSLVTFYFVGVRDGALYGAIAGFLLGIFATIWVCSKLGHFRHVPPPG